MHQLISLFRGEWSKAINFSNFDEVSLSSRGFET